MADTLDASGLTIETAADITDALVSVFQTAYQIDINTDQNTPDGQVIGILTQMGVDVRELLLSIYASFDPDQAVGAQLDQRCALNGVTRVAGTYTIQPMDVVASKATLLQGLDTDAESAEGTGYTIQDNNGNEFILLDSATFQPGTTTGVSFRAKNIGAVKVPLNTITNFVTVISGITSVNNSSAPTTVGNDEETDVQLRVKRARSVAIISQGYLDGLRAKLLELPGVTDANIFNNRTSTPDSNGIPAHGIWAIVSGGASQDIANTIYRTIPPGTDMKGAVNVPITSKSNIAVPIQFDRPLPENLYLQFSIKRTVPGFTFDTDAIAAYIATNLSYEVGAYAETSVPTAMATVAIASLGGGGVPIEMKVSNDGVTYVDYLDPTSPQYEFTLDASRINITVVA